MNNSQHEILKIQLKKTFLPKFHRKLKACHRDKSFFYKKNSSWIDKNFIVNFDIGKIQCTSARVLKTKHYKNKENRGRPLKSYAESSSRSKRRKNYEIKNEIPVEQMKHIVEKATKPKLAKISNEEALALYMDMDISKSKYNRMKLFNDKKIGKCYPSYHGVLLAKKQCYPENIEIYERGAKIQLQSLLTHTAKRIILSINPENRIVFSGKNITLFLKWGMDGSSGQQLYKQSFSDSSISPTGQEDGSIFIVCIVHFKWKQLTKYWSGETKNHRLYGIAAQLNLNTRKKQKIAL